jgi:hypothetical protein
MTTHSMALPPPPKSFASPTMTCWNEYHWIIIEVIIMKTTGSWNWVIDAITKVNRLYAFTSFGYITHLKKIRCFDSLSKNRGHKFIVEVIEIRCCDETEVMKHEKIMQSQLYEPLILIFPFTSSSIWESFIKSYLKHLKTSERWNLIWIYCRHRPSDPDDIIRLNIFLLSKW